MGRSRKLVLLVSALALALVALWLRDSGRGERVVEPRTVERPVPEDAPAPALLASTPQERVALSAQSQAPEVSAATPPTLSRAAEPTATRARLEIEVVEATLEPVPDVVVILERDGASEGHATNVRGRVGFDLAEELDPARPARVCVQLVAPEQSWVAVERATPPGQPLRLVMPPHGALDVDVLTAEGRPAERERGSVELALAETSAVGWSPGSWRRSMSAPIRGGRARFELVGLGLRLELSADSRRDLSRARSLVDGPRAPGERVAVTLQLTLDRTILVFHAVDERGHALSGELRAKVEIHSASMSTASGSEVHAGDDGRFEWILDPDYATGERRELDIRHEARGLSASVDLSRPFQPGRIDMGELVLRSEPLVASGRVVDPEGRPLAGLEVEAAPSVGTAENGEPVFLLGQWRAITGADGAFAVFGTLAPGPVRLELDGKDPQVMPLVVASGTAGVELVAQATGGLAGRVLFDPGVPYPNRIYISVHPDDDPENLHSPVGHSHEAQRPRGAFELDGLLPGSYTVAVTGDEVLAEVSGIPVVGGQISRDPRIQELDLRGRLHLFTFELVPPFSSFQYSCSLSYTPSGASAPVQPAEWFLPNEEPKLVTLLEHIDATLRVEGCRVERFTDLAPHTEVHLRAGLCVRLALPRGVELPARPLRLGATLLGENGEPVGASSQLFDEHGELRCFVPEPGRFKVGWLLERRSAHASGRGQFEVEPTQLVEVRDDEDEQRIELALTPEALARALDVR